MTITAEVKAEHRATWYVTTGDGEWTRRTARMRGTWGYDVACSCGWETRTGGATEGSVRDELAVHRFDAAYGWLPSTTAGYYPEPGRRLAERVGSGS